MIGAIGGGMKLAGTAIKVGAAIFFLTMAYNAGVDSEAKKWREVQVKAKEDKIRAINTLKDSLRSLSLDMQGAVEEQKRRNWEERKNAEMAKDALIDSIMSGKLRVRVRTKESGGRINCGGSAGEAGNTSSEGGTTGETTSELHPAVTTKLFGITDDADDLADDFNDLVDYTNELLNHCGASLEETQ